MSLGGLTTGKGCTVLVMAKTVVLFTEHEQVIAQLTAQGMAEINISSSNIFLYFTHVPF